MKSGTYKQSEKLSFNHSHGSMALRETVVANSHLQQQLTNTDM